MDTEPKKTQEPRRATRRLFDIRSMIGGILLVYGVVLIIVGLCDGPAAVAQATGIRINLWTGIAMFVVGALFLVWERFGGDDSRTAPPRQDLVDEEADGDDKERTSTDRE